MCDFLRVSEIRLRSVELRMKGEIVCSWWMKIVEWRDM